MSQKRSLAMPYTRDVKPRILPLGSSSSLHYSHRSDPNPADTSNKPSLDHGIVSVGKVLPNNAFQHTLERSSNADCEFKYNVKDRDMDFSITPDPISLDRIPSEQVKPCPVCSIDIGQRKDADKEKHGHMCLDLSAHEAVVQIIRIDAHQSNVSADATAVKYDVPVPKVSVSTKKRPLARTTPSKTVTDLSQQEDDFIPQLNIVGVANKMTSSKPMAAPIFNRKQQATNPKNTKAALRDEISSLDSKIAELQAKRNLLFVKLKKLDLAEAKSKIKKTLPDRESRSVDIVVRLVFEQHQKFIAEIKQFQKLSAHSRNINCRWWCASQQHLLHEVNSIKEDLVDPIPIVNFHDSLNADRIEICEYLRIDTPCSSNNCEVII